MICPSPEKFGVPVNIDYELGVSGDQLIKLEHTKIENKIIRCEYSGKQSAMKLLKDRIEEWGGILEYEVEKEEDEYTSLSELFVTQRAYAMVMGTNTPISKGTLMINLNNVKESG